MAISITLIKKSDGKLIKLLFSQAGEKCPRPNQSFFKNKGNFLLVALQQGTPVGFLYAYLLDSLQSSHPRMFLYSIDVFGRHKRKGIGTRLISRLIAICKRHSCSEMFVITNNDNRPAMRFYKKAKGRRENKDDVVFVWTNPHLNAIQ